MAMGLNSDRSKSTSDILNGIAYEEEMSEENSFGVENKYRTYTIDDLGERTRFYIKNLNSECKKERSTEKPQNFVKKLIASLEKKNEACKADDEFLTKYYKRDDCSNPNSDYSRDSKLRFSENVKRFSRGEHIPNSNLKRNGTHLENYTKDDDIENDALRNIRASVFSNEETIKQSYSDNNVKRDASMKPLLACSRKQLSCTGMVGPRNNKYYSTSYVKYNLQRDVDVTANDERKGHNDSSSFDPNRSRVEFENRMDIGNFCSIKRNNGDPKRSSFERIFISFGDEEDSKAGSRKKKVTRKKSLKDFFESMIRWKKSEEKEKPWRYMSCDRLLVQSDAFGGKNDKRLSRATSFQTVVFQDCDEGNMSQIEKRKATIRPIYGGKRYEHRLEPCAKKIQDRNIPVAENSMDDLIKPLTIKDMGKYFSQLSQKS